MSKTQRDARRYASGVFWVQVGFSFLLWVGFGVWESRRFKQVERNLSPKPRLLAKSLGLLFAGVLLLFGSLTALLEFGFFGHEFLSSFAWIAVTATGLLFVRFQTHSIAILATLARQASVTGNLLGTSTTEDNTPQ